jgi:predicted transcriptional regulator
MVPYPGPIDCTGETGPEVPIRDVMSMLRGDVRAVRVMADGKPIGQVTREAVLARLLNPRGAVVKA